MTLTRPMLAAPTKKEDLDKLNFPMLASPKIDGIRAVNVNGKLLSRAMKLIPNRYTQELFGKDTYHGLDGELVVGNPWDKNLMQQTMSGVMSFDGEPVVKWYVFDHWLWPSQGFQDRYDRVKDSVRDLVDIKHVPHKLINTYHQLCIFEDACIGLGFEGIMLRDPSGRYKQNRSTLKEGLLLKVKRFEDSEAEVLGFKEQMHNDNEATKDERGYTKRSTHQDNKRAAGVLGAFQVRDIHTGIEFDIGTGLTAEQRRNLWEGRKYLIGKLVKYKHFAVGVVDKPRFPTFVGFRDRRDL
jgi:DNA ligase-1